MSANTTTSRGVAQTVTAGSANKTAAGTSAAGAASQDEASGHETEGVEQVTVSKESFEAMKRQTAGQSALLRRLTSELDELKAQVVGKKKEGAEDEEGDGKKQYKSPYMRQLAELNEFKAKVESERNEMLNDSAKQSLYNGLVAKGVDPKLAGIVTDSLHGRIKGRVQVAKDALGRMALELKAATPEEEALPLDGWLEAFLGSDEGRALIPPEPNPTLRGVPIRRGGAPEGKIRITKEQMRTGQFNMEDMAAGKISVME
jgi:hypothetical protein